MASTRAYLRAMTQTQTDVGAILTLTNRVLTGDTGDDRFVTLIFARLEGSPERRLHPQHVKEIRGDQGLNNTLRVGARARDIRHATVPRGHTLERGALAADILEVGRGDAIPSLRLAGDALEHHHQR